MRSHIFVALGLLTTVAVACATGTSDIDEGDDQGSTGEPSGSGGAAGSSGSSGSMSGMPGSSSSASGGGVGGAAGAGGAGGSGAGGAGGSSCAEDPCKLVAPQCGCGVDEQCSLDGNAERTCVPAGDVPWKEVCAPGTECEPGNLCVTVAGKSVCAKYCADDAQCGGPGGLCIRTLNDANGDPIPDVLLCTESCDPATNMGCPAQATSCQLGKEQDGQLRFFTLCLASGAGTQGASCMANADCAPTFGCFNDGVSDMCLKYCKINAPNCPAGAQCIEITIGMEPVFIGNEQYGACI